VIPLSDNILNFPLFSMGKAVVNVSSNSVYPEWDETVLILFIWWQGPEGWNG